MSCLVNTDHRLLARFNKYDADGSGDLDAEELKQLLHDYSCLHCVSNVLNESLWGCVVSNWKIGLLSNGLLEKHWGKGVHNTGCDDAST
eukprot:1207704-Pyramimonas_sp.AAC.2